MDYDGNYHKLFTHHELLADLVNHFVSESWVSQLDFKTLERVNAKFHSEKLERREGDLIYKINTHNGEPAYLYLLLEFQSRPDRWMSLRLIVYIGLLYQQLIKEKRLTTEGRLPPVFPLVLYNGDTPWRAATELRSLIDLPSAADLWRYQPAMRYYLIDESQVTETQPESLSGLLFKIEQSRDRVQTWFYVGELLKLLSQSGYKPLKRDIIAWVKSFVEKATELSVPIEVLEHITEDTDMLKDRIAASNRQLFEKGVEKGLVKGLEKGLEKGVAKGRSQGEAAMIIRFMENRFGTLPDSVRQQLILASAEQLQAWSQQFVDGRSLSEMFPS